MDNKKILEYLYGLDGPKIKLGLKDFESLLDRIGNPQKQLRCIHVAGTNGKGSVCAMIFYILKEAGYKVGLYTSPHLKRFNERIRINDSFITDREIANYFLKIKPYITTQSFFEITTAMAFLYFKEKNVDYAVIEVGLGGRLDATNSITPMISVITNIGLEHTDILGKTIEKIAFEKAGIIKRGVPVVTSAKGKALKAIRQVARGKNAPMYSAEISGKFKFARPIKFLYLNGAFQQQNAKIALAAVYILKKFYSKGIKLFHIQEGIKKTKWPARLQFISSNVLLDAAHNPHGFLVLKKELKIIKNKIKNFIFVLGMQNDKDIEGMLNIIKPLASSVIFTKSKNEKASEPKDLLEIFNKIEFQKNLFSKDFSAYIVDNPRKALVYAKKIAGDSDLVVVTGSIYMVGELI